MSSDESVQSSEEDEKPQPKSKKKKPIGSKAKRKRAPNYTANEDAALIEVGLKLL
jgi:hypothetical protein